MDESSKAPIRDVYHEPSIEFRLSDITASPQGSSAGAAAAAAGRKQQASRSASAVDSRLKQKWKQQVQRERNYERKKAETAKKEEEEAADDNSSSIIELTRDLLVPCAPDACSDHQKEDAVTTKAETNLSNSILEEEAPTTTAAAAGAADVPVVTPEEKEKANHKVLEKLDNSGEKPVYSPQEQEYFTFHEQLYAPQDQEYLEFLKDMEQASSQVGDPISQQEDFARWLKGVDSKDLPPIARQHDGSETIQDQRSPKRVAFSKENTVRFFSRTREELAQLRRKYKKTISRNVVDVEDVDNMSDDEEDWPIFKFLDDKLKEMEESQAWNDPMAAVTGMLVPKDVKEQISPLVCGCQDQTTSSDDWKAAEREASRSRSPSLADLDDEELGPAMQVAASKASATNVGDKEASSQRTRDSDTTDSSGVSALWFAVPYKPFHSTPDTGESYIRPIGSPCSVETDKSPFSIGKSKPGEASRPLLLEENNISSTACTTPSKGKNEDSTEKEKSPATSVLDSTSQILSGIVPAPHEASNSISIMNEEAADSSAAFSSKIFSGIVTSPDETCNGNSTGEVEESAHSSLVMTSKSLSPISPSPDGSSNAFAIAKDASADVSFRDTSYNLSGASDTPHAPADPDAPKKESLSFLADDLDGSQDPRLPSSSLVATEPLNASAMPNDEKSISVASLGRNTNATLLRRVSEHLNESDQFIGTSSGDDEKCSAAVPPPLEATSSANVLESPSGISPTQSSGKSLMSLKNLFDHPALSNVRGSPTFPSNRKVVEYDGMQTSAFDDLVASSQKQTVDVAKLPAPSRLSRGSQEYAKRKQFIQRWTGAVSPVQSPDTSTSTVSPSQGPKSPKALSDVRSSHHSSSSNDPEERKKPDAPSDSNDYPDQADNVVSSRAATDAAVSMVMEAARRNKAPHSTNESDRAKEVPYDRKKQVVGATKRWAGNLPSNVVLHTTSTDEKTQSRNSNCTTSYWNEVPHEKKKLVVDAAKRWSESQKAVESTRTTGSAASGKMFDSEAKRHYVAMAKRWSAVHRASVVANRPPPEEGPDLDESKDELYTTMETKASHESELWDGVGVSPRSHTTSPYSDVFDKVEEGPDLDESKDTREEEIASCEAAWISAQEDNVRIDINPQLSAVDGPDLDETKDWDAFPDPEPNITSPTASVSQESSTSQQEREEWVAFPPYSSSSIGEEGPSFSNAAATWNPVFPQDETSLPQTPSDSSPIKSPRKHVRSRSRSKENTPSSRRSGQSTRVMELATKFEQQRRSNSPSELGEWGRLSPLTASPSTTTPWADDHKKENTAADMPDLQQPLLSECETNRSGSNQSSPVSVTLL